ncbi:MAG: DUF1338 domain-containing protein [Bacteriovoracia bacterium]
MNHLFEALWRDYIGLNPDAGKLYQLLLGEGLTVENDHVAFRTFEDPRINIDKLAQPFLAIGYVRKDQYVFREKKLRAWHFEHISGDAPKVFISELKTREFSPRLQEIVKGLVDQLPQVFTHDESFLWRGRPWQVSSDQYRALLGESEYAAWMAAFGFRANHFTVSLNKMGRFKTVAEFNAFIKGKGFRLNASGGEIKGGPSDFLEQSSTLANEIDVKFSDGTMRIPACYYEFAKRYPLPDGKLFQGFVEKSADKIFESTDTVKS